MLPTYIGFLEEGIERLHGCASKHEKTVAVKEVFEGKVVWEGNVEIFKLRGHEKPKRCCAWAHGGVKGQEGAVRCVAVLELPPVDSPQAAVRVAIVAEKKSGS